MDKREPGGSTAYPAAEVAEKNPEYGREMLSNIGGEDSEMSAVSLYFYNSLITRDYPDISQAFHRIGMAEMRHLQLFGELALLLGEDPRLWESRGRRHVYWTPRYIRYPDKLKKILSSSLYSEYMAAEKYSKQAARIKDPGIVAVLNRIILDEKEHIRLFKELLAQL
ncbi:manganese catalase family protein [Ruminococcaceae bacterium OttesenSCG-928-L11]|nr:manganese catalase family protein [Ruminococcaceae bacterium OttesenSCG-928-L11]